MRRILVFLILLIVRLILLQAQDAVPFMVSLSNHHDEVCVHLCLSRVGCVKRREPIGKTSPFVPLHEGDRGSGAPSDWVKWPFFRDCYTIYCSMQICKHYMRLQNAHLTQSACFTQPTKLIHITCSTTRLSEEP